MATAFTVHHAHHEVSGVQTETRTEPNRNKRGTIAVFLSDLLEDVLQKPLQGAKFAKHDMFLEHINAMSISYFALIVLLLLASVPVMACSIKFLVAY